MKVEQYLLDEELFIRAFKMKQRNKIRTIITYSEERTELKSLHEKAIKKLNKVPSSKFSFAYKKRISAKDAFDVHSKGELFIKLDISKFFESITKENFVKYYSDIIKKYKLSEYIDYLFYNDHIILGFITSPKMSDIYLSKMDSNIEKYIKHHKGLAYSRYCDDILISSRDVDFGSLAELQNFIVKELNDLGLTINEKKTKRYDLTVENSSINYLGLTYSIRNGKRIITIPKSYIVRTINKVEKLNNYKEDLAKEEANIKNLLAERMNKIRNGEDYSKIAEEIKEHSIIKKEIYGKVRKATLSVDSSIAYIKYNSKISYNRFMKKYNNKFKK